MITSTPTKIKTDLYLDEEITNKAKEIFKKYGVSLSDAINMFLTQSVREKGLPFEMKIPNEETQKAIKEAKLGVDIEETDYHTHIEEMKKCISN